MPASPGLTDAKQYVIEMARRLKCPMCGAIFVCNRRVECWCVRIRVSAQKLEAIRRVSDDCVCARCLKG